MGEQFHSLDQVRASAIDMAVKFGPKLLVAALILIAGYLAARWCGKVVGRLLARFRLEPPARALFERIGEIVVLGLFVIMAMQNLGVELLPLVAGLGVAGAGFALALQGVLGNVVAGLTIIFTSVITFRLATKRAKFSTSASSPPPLVTPTGREWSSPTARSSGKSSTIAARPAVSPSPLE